MTINKTKKYQYKYLQQKLLHWDFECEYFRINKDKRICFLKSWLNKINSKYNYV